MPMPTHSHTHTPLYTFVGVVFEEGMYTTQQPSEHVTAGPALAHMWPPRGRAEPEMCRGEPEWDGAGCVSVRE